MGAIITRNVGENIWIGPSISVRVVNRRGGKVALEITAPRHMKIWRGDEPPNGFMARGEAAPPCLKPGDFPTGGKNHPRPAQPTTTAIRGTP